VNWTDDVGQSPSHAACRGGDVDIVQVYQPLELRRLSEPQSWISSIGLRSDVQLISIPRQPVDRKTGISMTGKNQALHCAHLVGQ
jgi:hypothetical protein